MQREFNSLEKLIKSNIKGRHVYYAANSGNWGDSLIREGTTKFLRDVGIDYEELRLVKRDWILPVMKGGVVLYGGGGAWCNSWNSSEKYVRVISKRFKVIVLPSTYEYTYKIPNTIFTTRDIYNSKNVMPNALFCHDMAFYLGSQNYENGKGAGYFYRTDKESKGNLTIPASNRDISAEGNHFSEGITFFNELAKYSVIHTDRLHVAIASCLLDREVHLYPGSYFKNLAVFKSSIEPYFNNVHFHKS
jgi:exopolysaccharide biosynthesis predicted pyruvyltransferase EpsI